jgi:sec-independent protein translocase protein TatB
MWDTLLLMVMALVVFGPRRLPMIGRQLGKLMYEFRKASNDFKFQMEEELRTAEEADRRKKAEEERQRALAAAPPPAQLEATVSQTPANGAQEVAATQESGAPASAESPYSEGTDPNIGNQTMHRAEAPPSIETQPPETAPAAGPLTAPESSPAPAATIPHIQPPSTGEKIAAEPPGRQFQQRELFEEGSSPAAEPQGKVQGTAAPEAERSEPAAHNG